MERMAALEALMSQYDISMNVMKTDGTRVADKVEHYRCRLVRPGKEMNVLVSAPPEEGLTPADVLLMLILDASGCEMFRNYYDQHEEFSQKAAGTDGTIEAFDQFWQEYRSRCHQSEKLRTFLGQNLFRELIIKFGFSD